MTISIVPIMAGKAGGIVVITADYFIFDWYQLFGRLRLMEDAGTDSGLWAILHGWLNPDIVGMLPCSLEKLLQEHGVLENHARNCRRGSRFPVQLPPPIWRNQ
jgi:hypothetical protein